MSTLLVACGKSGSKSAASTNEVKTEDVTPKEESAVSLSETPLELADFAVECFRINEQEKLLQYATDRCQKRLTEDIAIEEQMKNNRGLKKCVRDLNQQPIPVLRSQIWEVVIN